MKIYEYCHEEVERGLEAFPKRDLNCPGRFVSTQIEVWFNEPSPQQHFNLW